MRNINLTALTTHSPKVMGILNITPDSFSDGGHFQSVATACAHARQMVADGVDIIDIGGESTRPGAQAVTVQEELDRVIPVIERLRAEFAVPLSIDTSKSEVMQASITAGVNIINDVNALQGENCLATVAAAPAVEVCLMHMQGEPRTMQFNPHYTNVVAEVKQFLQDRSTACQAAGIAPTRIWLDPGFGFGKTVQHNLLLMQQLAELTQLGHPVLIGVSRKSMLGHILDKPVTERLAGGLGLASWAMLQGASVIRTHDVAATVDVVKILRAVLAVEAVDT